VAALLEADEPKHRFFDRPADSQQPVVDQQRRLAAAKTLCDVDALFRSEYDAVKRLV
jgi:hypothetical protein